MSDYIKREDAIAAVERGSNTIRTIQRIGKIPAADVVERKTAGWLPIICDNVVSAYQCDKCWYNSEEASNYCPHCGADMRGGDAL